MRLAIKGYESIKSFNLEFLPGEIVGITGENNTGKSAGLRALRGLIVNEAGDNFINPEIGHASVAFQNEKGDIYKWKKTSKTSYYWKNKKYREKVNRSTLQEVFPDAGFPVEKEGSDVLVPSIVPEGSIIFPFNLTPGATFKIFSRFISTSKIGLITSNLKKSITKNKEDLSRVELELDVNNTALAKVSTELESKPSIDKLEDLKKKILKLQEYKLRVDRLEYQLTESVDLVRKFNKILNDTDLFRLNSLKSLLLERFNLEKEVFLQESCLEQIYSCKSTVEFLDGRLLKLGGFLLYKSSLSRIIKIADRIERFEGVSSLVKSLRVKLDDIGNVYLSSKEEYDKFKVCPYCGSNLDDIKHLKCG